MKPKHLALAALACLITNAAAPNPQTQAIEAFYRKVAQLKLSGLPDPKQTATLAPYLSSGLRTAITLAQREQARCTKAHPDEKPPWVDGDVFTSNAEGFTSFSVGAADAQGRYALRFTYRENGHRFDWQDAVTLRQEAGRWVIDDVHFRGGNPRLRPALASEGCPR